MPRERPTPPPFEPEWLDRSLDRYLIVGLVAMALLIGGFVAYRVREPGLRSDAAATQETTYRAVGADLFSNNCASCHGKQGTGGSAPTLNSSEFLKGTSNVEMENLMSIGIPGSDMPAWGLDHGGALTDEQLRQISTYLRSLEQHAPSIPGWRTGAKAP